MGCGLYRFVWCYWGTALPLQIFPLHGFDLPAMGPRAFVFFFVISGFLITSLLLNERERSGSISLRNFYVRRAYRILPASYVGTVAIAIIWHSRVPIRDAVFSLLYVQNFNSHFSWSLGHMWSLAVEEQFYLLWPFLLRRYFRHRYKIVFSAILIAPVFRAVCGWLGFHHAQSAWFPSAMDALAIGCLLALLIKEKDINWSAADRWFSPVLVGTLAIPQFTYAPGVQPLVMLGLQNLGIAFCVQHCIRKRYWALNWAPVVWIGVLSYSLYLFQEPFFQRHNPNIFEKFPANLACILFAAIVCHYFVEKPFLRLREKRGAAAKMIHEKAAV
jgi:peptidoglycan/LPS O-acetylase OafA/YrhL